MEVKCLMKGQGKFLVGKLNIKIRETPYFVIKYQLRKIQAKEGVLYGKDYTVFYGSLH